MRALLLLTPSESKRLIAKAVAALDDVQQAKEHGQILIAHGSTNLYVAEEIMGAEKLSELVDRDTYLSGLIIRGTLCATFQEEKPNLLVLDHGMPIPPAPTMVELLSDFGPNSVFIKGANAIDPTGKAGVLLGHPEGGSIGWAMGIIMARGLQLIVPVGLEKLVPSVDEAVALLGQEHLDYAQGNRVGMMPLSGATVITELEALNLLFGVRTTHVASGGTGGSEGSVAIIAEGDDSKVEEAIGLVEAIKGEPPLHPRKGFCKNCSSASTPLPGHFADARYPRRCLFHDLEEEQLPIYMRDR